MTQRRTQRLRDPVHGLIIFRREEDVDQLFWKLIQTPEFQRLRRIRQLGVSEFVFPSATHTRFAHSIGVFHTARELITIIERENQDDTFDPCRAEVAVIAALLHDLGHGPFSHTFEGVQRSRDDNRKHEQWSADIILNPAGHILPLLENRRQGLAQYVATLIKAEDPDDIYHAVVSSSFDADRLDYLRRDRLMTGTGAGAIDFDWLLENIRVRPINIEAADSGDPDGTMQVATFCLDLKALPAAEQFLLSRYTLHEQVYFHKTTRCIEHMIGHLLRAVAEETKCMETVWERTGLPDGHALLRFFAASQPSVADYHDLDDGVVTASLAMMTNALNGVIAAIATRLRSRDLYKTLDIPYGEDGETQTRRVKRIDTMFKSSIASGQVIKDDRAAVNIYTQIGGDDDRVHKKLHVVDQDGKPKEITKLSRLIGALGKEKRAFIRYYFSDPADRDRARATKGGRQ